MTPAKSISRKGFFLVLVPVVFELLFVAFLYVTLNHADNEFDRISRARDSVEKMHELDAAVLESVIRIVQVDRYQDKDFLDSLDRQTPIMRTLSSILADFAKSAEEGDRTWFESASDLANRTALLLEKTHRVIVDPKHRVTEKLKPLRGDIYLILMELQPLKQEAISKAKAVYTSAPAELRNSTISVVIVLVGGLVASVLLSFMLLHYYTSDFERRLKSIGKNAEMLAMNRPLAPTIPGEDEIAALDQVLHDSETALSESRRKEVTVLDNADDVIVSLDKTFHITTVGLSAETVWLYPQEELLGQSLLFFTTGETAENARNRLEEIAKAGVEGEFESTFRLKDGRLKDMLWSAAWSRDKHSYYCVAHDISEKRAFERLKQHFASIVSDDLNGSLSCITAGLDNLRSGRLGQLEDKTTDYLAKTQMNIDRLTDLVTDLLDLEKIQAGKLVVSPKPVSAAKICSTAMDAVEAFARGSKISITAPTNDATVLGDERRIVQVLINFISNAVKFSPMGSSVDLTIDENEDFVEISVIDNGPGIPKGDQAAIFEKFRQSKAVSDKGVKSSGLGLAIVKAIIDAHGGNTGVESEEGKGSRFWIILPKSSAANPAMEAAQ